MKVLSLFDGMSCARVALERANFNVERYFASEIDPYAKQVSQSNFPDIVQIGGVEMVAHKDAPIHYKLNDIDLLIGGSPCQDLSIAKKDRKGLDGSRSGLFWEYVRIRDEVKPKYFILENVASMPKEAKEVISEALGVEPAMINASLVSAQSRKRLFWVGKWNGEKYEQVEIPQPEDRGILLKDILEENVDEKYFVKMDFTKRFDYTIHQKPFDRKGQALRATDYKGTHNMIRVSSLNTGGQGDRIYSPDGKSVGLSANGGGRGAKTGLYAVKDKSYCIDANYHKGTSVENYLKKGRRQLVPEDTKIRKLTPTECLRLQSMPDDYFDKAEYKGKPISNTQRYKMCGNAFNADVVAHILSFIKGV